MTASRGKLVIMMYEGAIRFTEQARFHLNRGNISGCGTGISNAYNIVSELKVALDPAVKGDQSRAICEELEALYVFVMDKLVEANVERKVESLEAVLEILNVLKGGWDEALKQV